MPDRWPTSNVAELDHRRGVMSSTHDHTSSTEEHAAPVEAWDAIAEGYDRYVAL